MKILIVGTGGVGGYFGGRLAHTGHDVTFIARGAHKEAIEKNGLHVKSINGDFLVTDVNVTDQIANTEEPELVIISVKAWQVKGIARQLKPVIKESTMVLPLQNGVLASDELKEVLPEKNVLSGLCRIISKIDGPGKIKHLAVDPGRFRGNASIQTVAKAQGQRPNAKDREVTGAMPQRKGS